MNTLIENKYIYRSNGTYQGFVQGDVLYDRDGTQLGWIEGQFVWDMLGKFRGALIKNGVLPNAYYVWLNKFSILPLPKSPRINPTVPVLPTPPSNIQPVGMPVGWVDAFE